MKNMLIIGDNIREVNKLRRIFGTDFKISAVNSVEGVFITLKSKETDLIVYRAGSDLNAVFELYMKLRRTKVTENLPVLIITDEQARKALTETAEMKKAVVSLASDSEDELLNAAKSITDDSGMV